MSELQQNGTAKDIAGSMFQKSKHVINFGPGPAKLPEVVLERIHRELFDYGKTGISILELSHRSKEFDDLLNKLQKNIRDLASIPSHYQTLLMHGGGVGQFGAIPLNLKNLNKSNSADYMVTGSWSLKAVEEAKKWLTVNNVIHYTKKFTTIPDQSSWNTSKDASYFYYCANETIDGVEFKNPPELPNSVPLVADISSNAFSEPINVSKHGLLFASAQKNLGTAGVALVVVRDDLIGHAEKTCQSIMDYKVVHKSNSVCNTPPVFPIYVMNLVVEWIRDLGGLDEMQKRNCIKSQLIYDIIDSHSDFYHSPVDKHCRSRMNIPFRIGSSIEGDKKLEELFLKEAEEDRNMVSLKGYRTIGGIRASLYNAVTVEETNTLAEFMEQFYDKHKKE